MPSLKDILHKRDELSTDKSPARNNIPQTLPATPPPPEITFLRSDTFSQEVITPPTYHDHNPDPPRSIESSRPSSSTSRRSFQFLHRSSRSPSLSSPSPPRPRLERRLSNLLRLDHRRDRSNSRDSSANIPAGLPQIADDRGVDKEERESQWERRATVLVQQNPQFGQLSSPLQSPAQSVGDLSLAVGEQGRSRSSSQGQDVGLQDDVSWSVGREGFAADGSCRSIFRKRFDCMSRVVSYILLPIHIAC